MSDHGTKERGKAPGSGGPPPVLRVRADREACCGAGQCVLEAPEIFQQDEEDGLVRLLSATPPVRLRSQAETAADLCPARALTVRLDPGGGDEVRAGADAPALRDHVVQ
ncbi:ferredoxin [Streptomyces sp. NBC_01795]|uniref:ferredoxin n=1 Tax=Streptomyces sp. NBC_01795 TaxID=2975943 RepID=UPI002DD98CB9|nr:ferredoxin [Streptomyces sp. NBC_01795]